MTRLDEILEPLKILDTMPGYGITIKKEVKDLMLEIADDCFIETTNYEDFKKAVSEL